MQLEQISAHVLDLHRPAKAGDIHLLRDENVEAIVKLAWLAGRNYGYKLGGEKVLSDIDKTLGVSPHNREEI